MCNIRYPFIIFLFVLASLRVYAQHPAFDSLADEINRISNFKKTKSLEILDSMYRMAYNDPDSSLLLARCLYEESILNLYQGIVDTAMSDRINKRLAKANLSLSEHALLQSALGVNLFTLGAFSESFTVQLQALEKYKQLGNNRFTAKTLNALGNICSTMGLFSLTEYYYFEAITLLTPEFHEYYIIKSNIYKLQVFHDGKTAVDSLFILIEQVENDHRTELLPLLYLNTSSFLLHISLPEEAFSYFTKMQDLDIDNSKMTSGLYANLGGYYKIKKDYPQALNFFRKAQTITEQFNDFENLSKLYNLLSLTFEEQNQCDSALFYSRKHEEITQQLHSNTVAVETHQKYITTVLESSKQELIIAEQTIKLKNRLFTLIIIISASAVLLILLFLLFVNQQKRRKASENRELTAKLEHEKKVQQYEKRQRKLEKEKQKEVLDAKTREITSYSLLVSNKNQLLKQIMEINTRILDDDRNAAKKAAKIDEIIHGNLNTDEEWDNFKMHFDKVHPHFFKKLKQSFSHLTEENLKMCAYIKIGLTNKQIAQFLNVVPSSIIVSRYRLKKKMQLPDTEDLTAFIENL